jgi:hypothetical protein
MPTGILAQHSNRPVWRDFDTANFKPSGLVAAHGFHIVVLSEQTAPREVESVLFLLKWSSLISRS